MSPVDPHGSDRAAVAVPRGVHRDRPLASAMAPATAEAAAEVADGIWVSPGLSNAYMLRGETGKVVVNTGMGFEGPVHRALFDAVDPRPVRAVLITQGHYDHVGGIGHFLEPDGSTRVVVGGEWETWRADNDRLAAFRTDRSAFAFMRRVVAGIEHTQARLPGADLSQGEVEPTDVVAERGEVVIDGIRMELIPVRGGETRDSLVVWLPEQRTALVGNTFGPLFGHVPNLVTIRGDRYRDPLDVLDTLETVRALGAEVLVTGHYDPVVGAELIDGELDRMHQALTHVHDATVAGMNARVDVHTLMRTVQVPEHLDVGENYGQTKWNVRAIWENYAGWFHAASTTELFAVPAREVHPDLVALAGGADRVVEAARRRLEAGEPEAAIHLAEVARSADPGHAGAREVLLVAHAALRAVSGNFWEQEWLDHQISRFEKEQG